MHDIVTIIFGVAGLLALVSLLPPLARRLALPFSVLLATVGVALGAVPDLLSGLDRFGVVGDFLNALQGFDLTAEAFLYIFLPTLLFETALAIDTRRLLDDIAPIMLLAVVAVLITTFAIGFALSAVSSIGLVACLMLGAILATTDPAAVIGIFRDLGAPRRLSLLVEGESLLNDAAAIALFTLLLAMLTGNRAADPGTAVVDFLKGFAGGLVIGHLLARLACYGLDWLGTQPLAETTLTVALAYLTFVIAEHYCGVSGVVAVVSAGMTIGSVGRTRISPDTWDELVQVWRQLGFWASSLIFLLAAMLVPPVLHETRWSDLGLLAVLILAATAARAVVLYGLLPLLTAFGAADRVSHAYKAVMLWGGLRGAVSLALALAVTENRMVTPAVQKFIAVQATGFVLFTLFVNGTTLRPLMRLLGLDKLPPVELAMRNRAMALSLATIREGVQAVARDYQIDPEPAQAMTALYADRLKTIEDGLKEDGLDERTRLSIGLVTLTKFEEDRYLRHFKNGIISRVICERLMTRVGRLRDGARDGGLTGYQKAAGRLLSFTRRLRLALLLQRFWRVDWLLADQLSRRFETLLVTRMVLREMLVFNQRRIAPLLGQPMMRRLAEVLEVRLTDTEQALEALKLQFPEYSARLQRQYLGRAALRLERAQYRQMYADGMISQEVLDDLDRGLARRRQKLDNPPAMDLGLQLESMVAQVPIFSGLDRDRLRGIARVLKPRLAVPGERLVRRGERGDAMYFISSGTVEVVVPGRTLPIRLSTGEFFGEMALVTKQRRNADVRAVTFCNLLVLHSRDFERLAGQDAELGAHIGSVAKARLAPAASQSE